MSLFKRFFKNDDDEDEEEDDNQDKQEINILKDIDKQEREETKLLQELVNQGKKLSSAKIAFKKGDTHMVGPVILNIGQKTSATLFGFDQNGQPMPATFVMPTVTWTLDIPTFDSSTPNASNGVDLVSLSAGVANLKADVTSAEGLALSDTETVTNNPIVVLPPVLSSVKIGFSVPV